jgi:FkbH-like protein
MLSQPRSAATPISNGPLAFLEKKRVLTASLPRSSVVRSAAQSNGERVVSVRCDRSLPFEFVSELLDGFMSLWNARHSLSISDYDPALSSAWTGADDADVQILWLDWRLHVGRMTASETAEWIEGQVRALRSRVSAKRSILLNNWPETGDAFATVDTGWMRSLNERLKIMSEGVAGVSLIDLAAAADGLGADCFFDARNDEVSHYPFSGRASVAIARHLGLQLFPALVLPRLKLIALDLDDTLYSGVLGEDGWEKLTLTDGHRELQTKLNELKSSGILLAICSRNEIADVEELFRRRTDFPLRWDDFVVARANWEPKAGNLQAIASEIGIDTSAMIFVDDNAAELVRIAGSLPEVQLIHASPNGAETASMLSFQPGLFQQRADEAASMRADDVRANRIREEMHAKSDLSTYLAELEMEVALHESHRPHANRLHDLSQKTNQFNLAFARFSAAEADAAMGPGYFTLTVGLKDKLSDSGLIGAFVFKTTDDSAEAVEVIFSCRALGRDVETLALQHALSRLEQRGVRRVLFNVKEAPRNKPALDWVRKLGIPPNQEVSTRELLQRVAGICAGHPAKIVMQ